MNNQTDVSIKFKNSVTGEKKLEKYVQTLSTIKSVLSGIDKGTAEQLEASAKSTKLVDSDMKKMSKNFNLAFNYTALRTFARGLGKVVEGFTRMTEKSTSFLEDFNLFQVAFRGNYTEATKFVNKLSEMYGLDEDWLIKTTSQFKQLSNAMGLAEETGEKVSKLMTEMAIDISSLYNIDVDRASSVLQSALAGQTKPVRALGGDITQATLQQTLSNLNIDSQVSQLSYVEKRLLIIISLTQQLSGVTNDWGRTLESPSNQIRIMNEQWQRLQRNVGNLFMGMISKVLPYLNAILMVLTEIVSSVATLLGYKIDDFDFFDESAVSGIEDFGDGLDSATDSAKKLKQSLRGFDKLNVITTPTDSTGGAGGINPKLMEAFNSAFDEYQRKLDNVEMKATKIRDKIMSWLGFTKQVDEETGDVSFKFDHITSGTVLGALAVGGSIFNGIRVILKTLDRIGLIKFGGFKELFELIKGGELTAKVTGLGSSFESLASTLGMSVGTLGLVAAAVVAIGAALVYAYNENEEFRNKVNEMVSAVSTLFKDLYAVIKEETKEMLDVVMPLWNDFKNIAIFVLEYCYQSIVFNFSNIIDVITGVAKIISDIIHGDYKKAFQDFGTMVGNLAENFKNYFLKIFDSFSNLGSKMQQFVPNLFNAIKYSISNFNWFGIGNSILDGIIKGMWNFRDKIGEWSKGFVNGLKSAMGIHSPAKIILDAKIGDFSMEAITLGMERQLPTLKEQAESIVDTLNSGIKEATIDSNFNYDIPQFNPNSININANNTSASSNNSRTSFNPTFIIQVGNKELAKQVITDLQDMAIDNGKPITIGG